jgi:molybdenum cofactor cytidylyltransferase
MIAALLLAAGSSKRMGQPKMLLPWGHTTVLGQVIETLKSADIEDILVVTGGAREQVEQIITQYALRSIRNPDHVTGEMLSSIQVGIRVLSLPSSVVGTVGGRAGGEGQRQPDAALIVLGDQPQIEARSVRAVAERFRETGSGLVVPSFQMRRGHPWLAARPLWAEIEALRPPQTPRDFLNIHAADIEYVNVDSPSILADLDTPEDYLKSRP